MTEAQSKPNKVSSVIVGIFLVVLGLVAIGGACYGFLFYLPLQATYLPYLAVGFFAIGAVGVVLVLAAITRLIPIAVRTQEQEPYKFCPYCRVSLQSEQESRHCTKCKAVLKDGMTWCGRCSHPTQPPIDVQNGDKTTNPVITAVQKTARLDDVV